jgi:hypothetical protein
MLRNVQATLKYDIHKFPIRISRHIKTASEAIHCVEVCFGGRPITQVTIRDTMEEHFSQDLAIRQRSRLVVGKLLSHILEGWLQVFRGFDLKLLPTVGHLTGHPSCCAGEHGAPMAIPGRWPREVVELAARDDLLIEVLVRCMRAQLGIRGQTQGVEEFHKLVQLGCLSYSGVGTRTRGLAGYWAQGRGRCGVVATRGRLAP